MTMSSPIQCSIDSHPGTSPCTSRQTTSFISKVFWPFFLFLGSDPSCDHRKLSDSGVPTHVVQLITDFGKSKGLEVMSIEVDEHSEKLTTEEQQYFHLEVQQTRDKVETGQNVPSTEEHIFYIE